MVRDRIKLLAPSANLGHRGTGKTRAGHPFPENSISSFVAAMEAGADGLSLDVEITLDGQLIVMHDDTLDRTIFSSFDETVVELVKTTRPGYYSALLSSNPGPELVEAALSLKQDAIHPLFSVSAETVESALDAGLQVNVWTVNTADSVQAQLDKGATAIITDDPAVLAELLGR